MTNEGLAGERRKTIYKFGDSGNVTPEPHVRAYVSVCNDQNQKNKGTRNFDKGFGKLGRSIIKSNLDPRVPVKIYRRNLKYKYCTFKPLYRKIDITVRTVKINKKK